MIRKNTKDKGSHSGDVGATIGEEGKERERARIDVTESVGS